MVLYLTEDIINESVSGDEVINAIDNKTGVLITYNGEDNEHTGTRYIEPYVYGVTSRNNPVIRAYQYYGDTKSGTPDWKLLRLDRIESWKPTQNHFEIEPQARGWAAHTFNGNDKAMSTIYRVVELGEEPQSDLEKIRAKTRQLQQSEPVNINQINKINTARKSPVEKEKKNQTGPIGSNTPNTGVERPTEKQTSSQTQTSKPLNTDGTIKNNEQQPPVQQEPQKTGPVIGNPTKPEENSADELMSNDKFREMLKRNLNITDREKQNRGFNLGNNQ